MNKLAVRLKNVDKTFHSEDYSIHALKNIDYQAYKGEIDMIVGPSGCGKTTLLSVIAGISNIDHGKIEVFGVELQNMGDREKTEFRKANVGYIFQHYHLIPTLTALENISIPLLLNGKKQREAEEKSAQILERVGLKGREFSYPNHLSGGQKQRVAIARALVNEPPLIICDEPTASLDAESGSMILELFVNEVRSPNRSLIMVTHDPRIYKFADRIIKMDDGRILETVMGKG